MEMIQVLPERDALAQACNCFVQECITSDRLRTRIELAAIDQMFSEQSARDFSASSVKRID